MRSNNINRKSSKAGSSRAGTTVLTLSGKDRRDLRRGKVHLIADKEEGLETSLRKAKHSSFFSTSIRIFVAASHWLSIGEVRIEGNRQLIRPVISCIFKQGSEETSVGRRSVCLLFHCGTSTDFVSYKSKLYAKNRGNLKSG